MLIAAFLPSVTFEKEVTNESNTMGILLFFHDMVYEL